MLNKAAELGLFDIILERIGDYEDRIDGPTITLLLKVIQNVRCFKQSFFLFTSSQCASYIKPSFWDGYLTSLYNAVTGHIKSFEDKEMRDESLEDITDSLNVIGKLCVKFDKADMNADLQRVRSQTLRLSNFLSSNWNWHGNMSGFRT